MASMFSLGSWSGGVEGGVGTANQGGLEIRVFPTAQLQTCYHENHQEKKLKKPWLINLLIVAQPPNVNML